MSLTRRDLFRRAGLLGVAGAVGAAEGHGLLTGPVNAATGSPAGGTTLDRTLLRGASGTGGYTPVVAGPGEPHQLRTGLGVGARAGRRGRRRAVVVFGQISDVHVVDAQSPLRVEYLDRYGDDESGTDLVTAAYRPQEMLTAQISDAMVRALNEVGTGPVTGAPVALTLQTGDNSDNAQYNEVRWNIDLLDGARVRADSGDLGRWEGVADQDPVYYDTHYWHPDGTPMLRSDDIARSRYGFPVVPRLLDAARRPFDASGLATPWLTVFGNHDGLWQGNFPPTTLQASSIATGPLKLVGLPPGVSQEDVLSAIANGSYDLLVSSLVGTPYVRVVTPDPGRRLLSRQEWVTEHFATTGRPAGHGLTRSNRNAGTTYYTYDVGGVRFVVLDTVNPNGKSDGSLDSEQFGWLQQVLGTTVDRAVVVVSHHTVSTMTNSLVGTGGDPSPRVLGDQVEAELLRHHRVIAWVNGHQHRHKIWPHRRSEGGGFWEINTASHVEWPQQSRVVEVVDNRDGTWSIFTTVVDHAGPAAYGGRLDAATSLAGLGRELSVNDWQERAGSSASDRRGDVEDRNVELLVAAPTMRA